MLRDLVGCTLSAPPSREHVAGLWIPEILAQDILDLSWECVAWVLQMKTTGGTCSIFIHLFSECSGPPLCGTEEKPDR